MEPVRLLSFQAKNGLDGCPVFAAGAMPAHFLTFKSAAVTTVSGFVSNQGLGEAAQGVVDGRQRNRNAGTRRGIIEALGSDVAVAPVADQDLGQAEFAAEAGEAGWAVVDSWPLSSLFSGQRVVLLDHAGAPA